MPDSPLKYDLIDPIFFEWAKEQNFVVETEYKGYEVRSVSFYHYEKMTPQLWVEFKDLSSVNMGIVYKIQVSINHENHSKNVSATFNASLDKLKARLDEAYTFLEIFIAAEMEQRELF